jgi:Predicted nucleotide-binding protein containing TIR-like domain
MAKELPRVFIGSSSEALPYAQAARTILASVATVTLWNDSSFKKINEFFLDSLVEASGNFDFALLVFGMDDLVTIRKNTQHATRDNVIFELGLFWSQLGRERTYALVPRIRRNDYRILSDLDGLTLAQYAAAPLSKDIHSRVSAACNEIAESIRKLGRRDASTAPRTVTGIGRPLGDLMRAAKQRGEPVVIKNIALDMESTWPLVRDEILAVDEMEGVTWHSLMVDPESEQLSTLWSDTVSQETARNSERNVKIFCPQMRENLLLRQVDYRCKTYSAIPLVHGFLFNSSTAFISLCGLREGKLFGAPNPYIRIDKLNRGRIDATATHLIQAFGSWFDHQWTHASRLVWAP